MSESPTSAANAGHGLHMAITRHVRPECVAEFEAALLDFVPGTLAVPGMRGVHLLYPPPGSGSTEYGILRSFAGPAERDAFYASEQYRDWVRKIEPLTEGGAECRELDGLEVWFQNPHTPMPPRWKMALLTWLGVWPTSMGVAALVLPSISPIVHPILVSGVMSAGIVVCLTWIVMPNIVRLAHPWLHVPQDTSHPSVSRHP
ncbi:MAG TPA: antibiotic biosynthesis monooxygenase [Candidatus Methylacidiphilales bacterium]|nr:antibiotic biosynthesis monooxygenase [Candidatus Methylacidiphilales bacterium]